MLSGFWSKSRWAKQCDKVKYEVREYEGPKWLRQRGVFIRGDGRSEGICERDAEGMSAKA